jgi:cytochrome P450
MPRTAKCFAHSGDFIAFQADPLTWLTEARDVLGPVVLVRESGAVFSRAPDGSGVVAVFGAGNIKQVLADPEAYAMPASAAVKLGLPPRLAQLNRSLHSMREPEHGAHKRALGKLLGGTNLEPLAAQRAMQACTEQWPRREPQPLLARMRELSVCLAKSVLLGPGADPSLSALLHEYFLLRREAGVPAAAAAPDVHALLLSTGRALDRTLRHHLRSKGAAGGTLSRLLCPVETAGLSLSEDDATGHANILFVSATEPVAVSLTWTLLLLSQQPDLRRSVREDPGALDEVLLESLRLLPPNGFMVRQTTRAVRLDGVTLPARCEVILCPLLSHRDADVFERPRTFLPQRWRDARPTSYEYFPFGAGGHACVGRSLAMDLLRTALAYTVQRFDTVLDVDQDVDWRIHIMFMPRDEIRVRFEPPGAAPNSGRWNGPVTTLIDLPG